MMNRRDMLAAGLFGSVAPGGGGAETQEQRDVILQKGLTGIDGSIDEFKNTVEAGMRGNSMNFGGVALVNARIGQRRLFGRRAVAGSQAG